MLVDIIVYSKDRAAQLDLLLRSLYQNFENLGNIFVLYDYSNQFFDQGYTYVQQKFPNVKFIYQTKETFAMNMRSTMAYSIKTQYVLPFCDDDVMIHKTNIDEIIQYFDYETVGVSLRHSLTINLSYHTGEIFPLPSYTIFDHKFMKWRWNELASTYCWGYPYMAGGCIYETKFLSNILHKVNFILPNSMESVIMNNRFSWNRWNSLCFIQHPIVNVSINKVQNENHNRGGRDIHYSTEELNSQLLSGKQINLQKIADLCKENNTCQFVEIPLELE